MNYTFSFLNHAELVEEYQSAVSRGESVTDFRERVLDANIFGLSRHDNDLYFMEILEYNYQQGLVPGGKCLNRGW